jgi:hypothetical protein
VPDPSPSEFEIAIAKLKSYKSPGSDQILAELVQAGGETLRSVIRKLVYFIWNMEELPIRVRSLLLYQFTGRMIKLTLVIIVGYHCYPLHTKFYRLSPYVDEII